MAITNTTLASPTYNGNGATTAFATGFQFLQNADLLVTVTDADGVETVKTITTHYTVTGAGSPSGGTVTFLVAPITGEKVNITSNVTLDQQTDYVEGGSFAASTHETALDKLTKISQQLQAQIDRAIVLPVSNQSVTTTTAPVTAGYVLRVADDATSLDWTNPSTIALGTTVSAFAETLLDDTSASAARTTLGLGSLSTFNDADPNADRLVFWDDSAGSHAYLTLGTGLTITGTTIDASASGSGTSFTRDISQAAHGFSVGNLLYLNGSTYTKAIATSAAAAEVVGIVSAVADSDNFTLQFGGRVTGLSGLTTGAVYFLSSSSAGTATATEPSTAGQVSKPVYIADSTTTGILTLESRGSIVSSAGVLSEATQSDMETGTSTTTYVSPAKAQLHPSAAKAWVVFTTISSTTNQASYNVTSLTDNGTGDTTITIATDFSGSSYCANVSGTRDNTSNAVVLAGIHTVNSNRLAGSLRIITTDSNFSTPTDYYSVNVIMYGDQ